MMKEKPSGNAKRLAKNTILMYIRMLILLCIGFLISRILLQKLGITDFGIYSLIGSIIAMFSSMKGLFVTATQRFLNYEMGKGNDERLKVIFNMSIVVNLIVSIFFAICVEILGLWFIYNEINVPEERIFATKIILHLSVATTVVYIMTTPLDALVIAHEKMGAYAYLTILDHLLKLIILFFLFLSSDRLIFYAFLLLLISIVMRMIYEIYCRKSFSECRYSIIWDKKILSQMLSFAGWQFLGSSSYTLTHNGLNMLLNTFGGTAVNAARGIAYQANAAVNQLIINMELVISPFSVKSFAQDDKDKMFRLFFFSSKMMFLISIIAILPILFFTKEVIHLWLGSVPDYSIIFLQLLMVFSIVRSLHTPIDTLFRSVGRIKNYQITESVVLAIPLLISYIALKFGAPIYSVFIFVIIVEILNFILILLLAKQEAKFDIAVYIQKVVIPLMICLIAEYFLYLQISSTFFENIILLLLGEIIAFATIYMLALTCEEKKVIRRLLFQWHKKI